MGEFAVIGINELVPIICYGTYLTVQTKGEQHDEEENGPQRRDG